MTRQESIKIFFDSIAKAYIEDLHSKKLTASGKSEAFNQHITVDGGTMTGTPYFYLLWNKKNPVGRRPGKMPPVEAIIQWLKDKKTFNIETDRTKGLRSLAFAIAMKIKKRGTDIAMNKRPSLNVDDKIEEYKKTLMTQLSSAATRPIKDQVGQIQNVAS